MENEPSSASGTYAVPVKEKLSYGFGCFGQNLIYSFMSSFLMIFYTDVFGIGAAAVGTMFLVARIWDAVNDPLMGLIVDHTGSRWGRFRPYLLFSPVPVALATVLCFSSPDLGPSGRLVYAYITYIAWGMSYTALDVPFWSLSAVITQNSEERNKVVVFPRMIGTVGYVAAIVAVVPLVSVLGRGNEKLGYQLTAAVFGIVCIALCLWTFFSVRERVAAFKQHLSMSSVIRIFTSNPPLLMIIASGVLSGIAFTARNTILVYFIRYNVGDMNLFPVVSGLYVPFTVIGMLLVPKLCRHTGKRNAYIFSNLGIALTSLGLMFSGWNSFPLVLFWILFSGIFAGIPLVLQTSMLADTIEYAQWKTGLRAAGLVFSTQTFMAKLTAAVSGALVGWLLVAVDYVPNIPQNLPTLKGIHFMMSGIPFIGALLAVVPMIFYPLTEKMHEGILAQISAEGDAGKKESENESET